MTFKIQLNKQFIKLNFINFHQIETNLSDLHLEGY